MKAEILAELRKAGDEERPVVLGTVVGGRGAGNQIVIRSDGATVGGLGDPALDERAVAMAQQRFTGLDTERVRIETGGAEVDLFFEALAPRSKLIVVGAVHVAIPLVRMARELGFRTYVIDPRSTFATSDRFGHADVLMVEWPEQAFEEIGLNETSYVAVLTHDLKIDVPALRLALRSPARYVGVLGSRRTHAKRVELLRDAGLGEREIARIRAPIGLDLGGRRPEEIAVAILAEIVAGDVPRKRDLGTPFPAAADARPEGCPQIALSGDVPRRYAIPGAVAARAMSPALLIFLDHVRENVRRVIAYLDGEVDRWRPHVKTTKIPAVMSELVRAGLRSFKCATTREAEELSLVLERSGCGGDVLVAYPLIGPSLARLEQIAAERPGTTFSVLCEDPRAVDGIPASLGIYADVDPGMNRTGIPATDRATILEVGRRAGGRFRGIHYYEGHIRRSDTDREGTRACLDVLVDLVHWLEQSGLGVGEAITSGTPTFLAAAAHPGLAALEDTVHRVSPGTVVYHDLMTEQNVPDLDLLPAAIVLSRVVSHPREGAVTCDAGSKAIAAEAGDPCAYVLGHPGLVAAVPSEEHLPLDVVSGSRPQRGTELLLVPRHVCPTVNLAEKAILIEAGAVAGIVDVSARAHEVRILE